MSVRVVRFLHFCQALPPYPRLCKQTSIKLALKYLYIYHLDQSIFLLFFFHDIMSPETHATASAERNIDVVTHAVVLAPPDQDACPICFEPWNTNIGSAFGSIVQTQCEHIFHRTCLGAWFDKQDMELEENTCPCCRTVCSLRLRQPAYRRQHVLGHSRNTENAPVQPSSSGNSTDVRLVSLEDIRRRFRDLEHEAEAQNAQICTMGASQPDRVNDNIRINRVKLDRIR